MSTHPNEDSTTETPRRTPQQVREDVRNSCARLEKWLNNHPSPETISRHKPRTTFESELQSALMTSTRVLCEDTLKCLDARNAFVHSEFISQASDDKALAELDRLDELRAEHMQSSTNLFKVIESNMPGADRAEAGTSRSQTEADEADEACEACEAGDSNHGSVSNTPSQAQE